MADADTFPTIEFAGSARHAPVPVTITQESPDQTVIRVGDESTPKDLRAAIIAALIKYMDSDTRFTFTADDEQTCISTGKPAAHLFDALEHFVSNHRASDIKEAFFRKNKGAYIAATSGELKVSLPDLTVPESSTSGGIYPFP